MAQFLNPPIAYGQSQPLVPVMPLVQEFPGVPTPTTQGVLGQILINKLTQDVYILAGIIAGASDWVLMAGAGGNFNSLTVTTTITASGNITSSAGDLITTLGDVVSHGNVEAQTGNIIASVGNITASEGNITASEGNIVATEGHVFAGTNLYTAGDDGTGEAATTSFTSATDVTQGAGHMTILSTTANPGDNAGFIKIYVGTAVAWVPYFTDIAP